MTHPSAKPEPVNPLAQVIREAAARQTDPKEAESLLQSAERVEAADRALVQAMTDLDESIKQNKAAMEALRRRDHLPTWVVWAVLFAFLVFLVDVALEHHL